MIKKFIFILALLFLTSSLLFGQTVQNVPEKKTEKKPNKNVSEKNSRELLIESAVENLSYIINDLKQIDELPRSLPIVEVLVSKLRQYRPDRCRELLEVLFDKFEEQLEKKEKEKQRDKYWDENNYRSLIRIAGNLDAELAKKFIDRASNNKKYSRLLTKSDASLSLASELVEKDPSAAEAIASQQAGEMFTLKTLEFIGNLRNTNPDLAKNYLAVLFGNLETRKYPSVNELYFLYSYIFLSKRVPTSHSSGLGFLSYTNYGSGFDNQAVDIANAKHYLTLSAKIMLQSERYYTSGMNADAKTDAIFINFIIPLVRQYLPDAEDILIQRKSSLLSSLDVNSQQSAEDAVTRYEKYKENKTLNEDTAEGAIEKIDKSNDPKAKKDKLYFSAARQAIKEKKYSLALSAIEKISTPENQTKAKDIALFEIAGHELDDGKPEEARRRISEDGDVVLKAEVLIKIAASYIEKTKSKDFQKCSEILDQASSLAGDLPPGVEKVSILSGISAAYASFNPAMSLDYLRRCIQATEKVDAFNGEFQIMKQLELDKFYFMYRVFDDNLNIYAAVRKLAQNNFAATIVEAKALSNPIAKTKAIVTACQSVLSN